MQHRYTASACERKRRKLLTRSLVGQGEWRGSGHVPGGRLMSQWNGLLLSFPQKPRLMIPCRHWPADLYSTVQAGIKSQNDEYLLTHQAEFHIKKILKISLPFPSFLNIVITHVLGTLPVSRQGLIQSAQSRLLMTWAAPGVARISSCGIEQVCAEYSGFKRRVMLIYHWTIEIVVTFLRLIG